MNTAAVVGGEPHSVAVEANEQASTATPAALNKWQAVEEAGAGDTLCVTAPAGISPLPLPEALTQALPERFPSDSAARRACRNKGGPYRVLLPDGKPGRCASVVESGSCFRVVARTAGKVACALDIAYEDEHIVVVKKPPGLVVHGEGVNTLCHQLSEAYPGASPCHRLDAPTEGLVVCGRTKEALASMQAQFSRRGVSKRYRALVHGSPPSKSGSVTAPIDDLPAETVWRVVWRGHSPSMGPLACLELEPTSGRKHQLRRHLSERLLLPIVGDIRYCGDVKTLRNAPLLLVALEVAFDHPASGERISVRMEEPARFSAFALLPQLPDASLGEQPLLAQAIQAGQRCSQTWKQRWGDFCGPEERDPKKRPLSFLKHFLVNVREEFEGQVTWLSEACWALADTPEDEVIKTNSADTP